MTEPTPSLFDTALPVSPPLSDEQLAAIPAKRGVLLLEDEGGRPILLLTAADIRARLRGRLAEPPPEEGRKKTADLRQITRQILYRLCPSHFETDLTYFELARTIYAGAFKDLLSWRPAWFVQVDPQEKFPHFARTREADGAGLCIGPFESGHSAQRFIEALEDLFDLCRDYGCLRQAPTGPACSYLQMGRCLGPCNGTISLDDYRQVMARAAAFAAGDREPAMADLQQRMQHAAATLEFEKASTLKKRLERAKTFTAEEYQHTRPLEQFRFILVQPAASKKQHEVFLCVGGTIVKAAPLDKIPTEPQLAATLTAMTDLANRPRQHLDEAGRYRVGLVTHYLYCSPAKRGVIIHWPADMTPSDLAATIKEQLEPARI